MIDAPIWWPDAEAFVEEAYQFDERIGVKFVDEPAVQKFFAGVLDSVGWVVKREVTPDGSNDSVDVLAWHPGVGSIGFELKHIRSFGQGGRIHDAYRQITDQYWNKQYDGDNILLWAIVPYVPPKECYRNREGLRTFITPFGIGWVNFYARPVRAKFGHPGSIDLFDFFGKGKIKSDPFAVAPPGHGKWKLDRKRGYATTDEPPDREIPTPDRMDRIRKSVASARGVNLDKYPDHRGAAPPQWVINEVPDSKHIEGGLYVESGSRSE